MHCSDLTHLEQLGVHCLAKDCYMWSQELGIEPLTLRLVDYQFNLLIHAYINLATQLHFQNLNLTY